jgi:ribonuclease HI
VGANASARRVVAHIDGGSRGNPGPAAYGVVLETAEGLPLTSFSRFLGRTTNNFAEYQGLLAALRYVLDHGYGALDVISDSELLVRQIQGRYKVNSADLRSLYEEARRMIARLESFSIRHVMREENQQADRLANEALDAKESGLRDLVSSSSQGLVSGSFQGMSGSSQNSKPGPLRASATFREGRLEVDRDLPLRDGEIVELEIRRRR